MLDENKDALQLTHADVWHKNGYTGKGVTVAVLDDHSTPHDHMTYASAPFETEPRVGHGTNVAQCVHAFAPDARVLMFSSNDETRAWIKEHQDNIDIVNISRSASRTLAEHSYGFLEAFDAPVVCSAGNDSDERVNYPSRFSWTISVGAYEQRRERVASYSNAGERLDCVALTDIYVKNSVSRVFLFDGTSASAPTACGLLACWMQYRRDNGLPKPSREDARSFIHEHAHDIEDEGFDHESGHGLFLLPQTIPAPREEKKEEEKPSEDVKGEDFVPKEFKDVSRDFWAYDDVQFMVEEGLMSGYDDDTFKPNNHLTRAQFSAVMANIIRKYLK